MFSGTVVPCVQVAGCFSQPNGGMCQQMLSWAVDVTRGSSGDLLELYCGNGNFTLPLAQNFKQVRQSGRKGICTHRIITVCNAAQ